MAEGQKDVSHDFDQTEELTLDGYVNLTENVICEHEVTNCENMQQ